VCVCVGKMFFHMTWQYGSCGLKRKSPFLYLFDNSFIIAFNREGSRPVGPMIPFENCLNTADVCVSEML